MYGRMQFADYVVSWALQSLSRSLQKVGGRTGPAPTELRCSDQKALAQTAERIFSLWQMAQWSVSKIEFKRAQADLAAIVELCSADRSPEREAAERLLEKAEPKARQILEDLVGGLAPPAAGRDAQAHVLDRLNDLLQAESVRWRTYTPLRIIDQSELVEHGMLRAFEKSRSLSERLDGIAAEAGKQPSAKRLVRTGRWTQHCVNHLELLRPALSEAGRTRRWHLTRLAHKLDEQWALEKLARMLVLVDLKPKASVRLKRLIGDERKRLDKQRRKLTIGAFAGGSMAYRGEVMEAVAQLGLEAITLLPLDVPFSIEKETG
ncbi:MAG: hypothetical protein AB7I04_06500 [Pseudomonadales bacterium]